MPWRYVLQDNQRMPPCPYCGSLSGTVRLRGPVYACMDCLPRRAFEAHWEPGVALSDAGETRIGRGVSSQVIA